MKINKGLGYLAVAAMTIATLYFLRDGITALAMAGIGLWAIDESSD